MLRTDPSQNTALYRPVWLDPKFRRHRLLPVQLSVRGVVTGKHRGVFVWSESADGMKW